MGRFKYLLTTIAVILLPLVAVSEQIQTNLIQIPIMAEKKAELDAMLFKLLRGKRNKLFVSY